jgi:hypothetical protein
VSVHDSVLLRLSRVDAFSRLACSTRGLWRGRALHRAGLWAQAADRYRAEGLVEPLARLRVHELMIRSAASTSGTGTPALDMEIERRLLTLTAIETLAPPFTLVAATALAGSVRGVADDIARLPARAGAAPGLRILRQAA